MLFHATSGQKGDFVADAFAAIDFELALDLADTGQAAFEDVVAQACRVTGGRTLFVMPPAPDHLGIVQIAAVRIGGTVPAPLVFVVEEDGRNRCIRLARREEAGDRFFGFAKAYARIMDRLTPNTRSTTDA